MATYYSQGSGAWSTLANWDTVAGGGGSDPASVAAMDDQTFIIQAGHNIEFDIDSSGFAAGIAGITINGGATPGMLYPKHSAAGTYYLKLKTGTTIAGTTVTNRGRLLANSNGTWGATGDLPFDRKFIIDLGAAGYVNAENLDIALYCTNPQNLSVDAYGTKYTCTEASTDVNAATDLITFAEATPPAEGTAVMVRTAGVLPGGLTLNDVYYVRSITDAGATFTCKLALTNSDTTIVNITSAGSGALYMYSGHTNTSTATLNIIQNVTADAQWVSGASVVLVDANAPENYDQQRVTINGAPNAGDITLSATVDSAQIPLAKIFLMTRNVAIRSACTTSINIISYATGSTHGGVFQCEISSTAGTGTTFYGNGINYGVGATLAGTISGCNYGINYGTSHTNSGTVSGCSYGISGGTSHTNSGTISGCSSGIIYGTSHTNSGTISGCNYGINYGISHTNSGTISGCNNGIYSGASHINSGIISGCNNGIIYGTLYTNSGTISGCNNGISYGIFCINSGTISGCGSTFRYNSSFYSEISLLVTVRGSSVITPSVTYSNRNLAYGNDQGVYFEDYGGVLGASYAALAQADVYKNTVTVRTGGATSSIEVIPLSSLTQGYAKIFEWTELEVSEDAELTKTIYVKGEGWTSFPTAAQLWFEAEYLNHASLITTALVKSTQVLTDNTTWTALSVTFTPLQKGQVRYKAYFSNKYEAACKVYIDNALYTS